MRGRRNHDIRYVRKYYMPFQKHRHYNKLSNKLNVTNYIFFVMCAGLVRKFKWASEDWKSLRWIEKQYKRL